ncbi:YoaH family protein [Vibrio sp. SS-MA-C1-2]|uniref:YoaH family protein n=1 Tax=Vibrio sp. SS-MA-C1-2 TaxID=2908646 RepID=UPI001F4884F8|nr:YoaH family protein [Vibrio sp. SS-MA-C1-2]UJF17313.1 YoaH family protein [Vibrio sp. SS-MA-C1-2]
MRNNEPVLNHNEQQIAAEKIQKLMAEGMPSGAAIMQVANELREKHQAEKNAQQESE